MSNRYGLTIRAADAGDVDGLGELLRSGGLAIPRDQLAARLAAVREQPGALLLAEEWGPPTGVLEVRWSASLATAQKTAEIGLLLVDPERRRNGVARLLLKAASQAARTAGCGRLVLPAPTGSGELEAFAMASGFALDGVRLSRSLRKQG